MRTILLLSGGLDSTVLLHDLLARGWQVRALSVDYGQRHVKELARAKEIASRAGVEHRVADLGTLRQFMGDNALTSESVEVPDGHYADETMKVTVVPNRNMVLLSVAASWAIATKSNCIAYAAHAGDHTIYPDCRPEFIGALNEAVKLADWHSTELVTPFANRTKAEIVSIGAGLDVPFHLTWSCYKGGERHCGRCGTCVERREAFTAAGITDPTDYGDFLPETSE